MRDRYVPPGARGEQEPVVIPEHEVVLEAARASGPGGQSVNKTSSKVVLKWELGVSGLLSEEQKELVRENLSTRINKDDVLVLHVQKSRKQSQNRQIALERLNDLINAALEVPEERKPTKLPKHKKEKRLKVKKQHAQKKALRKKPSKHDW